MINISPNTFRLPRKIVRLLAIINFYVVKVYYYYYFF